MNLRSLDLNLLVILDALLDEAHVTRAANRLALSQPATSSALERCRHQFQDRLLERGSGGRMQLTPRAQALQAPLKEALAAVGAVVEHRPPSLRELRQPVRIFMADFPGGVVEAGLYASLQDSAPGIQPVLLPWRSEGEALKALEAGEADIVVAVLSPAGAAQAALRCEPLMEERYLAAMRKGHPAARRFDLERWLAYPHLVVSSRGQTRTALDRELAAMGRERRVGMVLPAFAQAQALLAHSDMIALLPSRCLMPPHARGLAVFEPPLPVEGFTLSMAWHARREQDPATRHVMAQLRALVTAL